MADRADRFRPHDRRDGEEGRSGGAASLFADRVVLLSGDVHTSQATRKLSYQATQQALATCGAATSARVVFAQIVASALHNQNEATLGEHVDGYSYLPGFKAELGAQPVLRTEGFVGWNSVTTVKRDSGRYAKDGVPASLHTCRRPRDTAGWQYHGTRHFRSRSA